MDNTADHIGIIARAVSALQTTNEQGLSGMTRLKEFTMLISPYPDACYYDSASEVWTNLGVLALSVVLSIVCVCRMNVLTDRHKLVVRLRYLILFCGSLTTAMAPWAFPDNPRLGGLVLVAALVLHLLLSAAEWKNGAPAHTESDWAKLSYDDDERRCDERYCFKCAAMGKNPDSLWCRLQRSLFVVAYILRGDKRRDVQSRSAG